MTFPVKPTVQPRWATLATIPIEINEPTSGQKDSGWTFQQKPPRATMNWLGNTAFLWTDFLEKFADTIVANIDIDTGTDIVKLFTAGGEISLLANGNVDVGGDFIIVGSEDKYLSVNTTVGNAEVTFNLSVKDGVRNHRVKFFLDDATGLYGFDASSTSFVPDFVINALGSELFRLTASGDVGIGTDTPDFKLQIEDTGPGVYLKDLTIGSGVISQGMSGLLMTVEAMGVIAKYTPAIKFGSTDPNFTTTNPKFLAGIVGRATEDYVADTDSGMGIDFLITPNNAGGSSVPVVGMTLDQDGNIGIGADPPLEKLHLEDGNMRISALGATDPYTHYVPNNGTAGSWMVGIDDSFNALVFAFGLPSSSSPFGTSADKLVLDNNGRIGMGVSQPNVELHIRNVGTALRIDNLNEGHQQIGQLMSGAELFIAGMDTTKKYTPALKFGSTDPQFTTRNPKFLAGLVGFATENYDANTDSGMGMEFLVTPDNAGADPIPTAGMILDQDSNLTINGELFVGDGIGFEASPAHLIKVKVLEIGTWNISSGVISIAHGLAFDDIMAVKVIIRNDANTLKVVFAHSSTATDTAGNIQVDSTNIILTPVGTFFTAPDWNGTGFNRGFIIIDYIGAF